MPVPPLQRDGNSIRDDKQTNSGSIAAIQSPAIAESMLRGDIAVTAAMEVLQIAYLHAVVSAARCSLGDPRPDRRLDWVIHHQSGAHVVDNEADLKVQLKSTSEIQIDPDSSQFSFRIENAGLEYLNFSNPTVNKILVVMTLPDEIDEWIHARHDHLTIRRCCYWVNLAGVKPTGAEKTTIKVPTEQIFDHRALCSIMQRVGAGGKP